MKLKEMERKFRQQAKRLPNKGKLASRRKRTQKLEVDLLPETRTAPQELKKLRTYFGLINSVPADLPAEAQLVLRGLFDCFDKAANVSEGIVEELMWGFEQAGFPRKLTAHGLVFLEKAGYVKFQTRDNVFVRFQDARLKDSWIRYQPKLLEMVYEKS